MYYADYLRVFSYNFHMKDFKEKQEDKGDQKIKKIGGGDRGDQSWKKEKKQRGEEGVVVVGDSRGEAEEEVVVVVEVEAATGSDVPVIAGTADLENPKGESS